MAREAHERTFWWCDLLFRSQAGSSLTIGNNCLQLDLGQQQSIFYPLLATVPNMCSYCLISLISFFSNLTLSALPSSRYTTRSLHPPHDSDNW